MDIVIPAHTKDFPVLPMCVASCRRYLPEAGEIYVVTNVQVSVPDLPGAQLVDETKLQPIPLTREDVYRRWRKEYLLRAHRAGWLYQQFIKLGFAWTLPNLSSDYLIVDADVVFLRELRFFENGKATFTKGFVPPYPPYVRMFEELLGEKSRSPDAFVAHHMPFSREIVHEMLRKIEALHNRPWFEAVLDRLDYRQVSGVAEYELYALYNWHFRREQMEVRELRCIENLHHVPERPEDYAAEADMLALHAYQRERGTWKWKLKQALRTAGLAR